MNKTKPHNKLNNLEESEEKLPEQELKINILRRGKKQAQKHYWKLKQREAIIKNQLKTMFSLNNK